MVIRSNGGTVTLNDSSSNGKIYHYGNAEVVDAQQVAYESLHECDGATVALIKIKSGHVELEKGSDVNGIYIYNGTEYDANGKATTVDTSFDNVKITVANGVEQPKLSRSAVAIADEGTKVCTLVTETSSEDYYLFKQGIYEQVKVVDTNGNAEWADDTNVESIETAADQIANDISGTKGEDYTVNEETRDLTIVHDDKAKVDTNGTTSEKAQESSMFKGKGTEDDPFLIYNYETMQKVSDFYDLGYYYFEVDKEKTIEYNGSFSIDCTGWYPVKLHGSFDGNGVKFTNVDAKLFSIVGYGTGYVKDSSVGTIMNDNIDLSDFDVTLNIVQNGDYSASAMVGNLFNLGTTTFSNINVHGYLEGYWNNGSFYNYGPANYNNVGGSYTVKFNNCTSDATIVCTTGNTSGGFIGHGYEGSGNTWTVVIDSDSAYTGTMYGVAASDDKVSGSKWFAMCSNVVTTSLTVAGEKSATFPAGTFQYGLNSAYTNKKAITLNLATKSSNGYYVTAGNNASRVVVSVTAQMTAYDSNNNKIQNLSGITMGLSSTIITDIADSIKLLDSFSSIEISYSEGTYSAVVENGVLRITLSDSSYKTGTIRLQVTQYDERGNVVCAGTSDLATKSEVAGTWTIK